MTDLESDDSAFLRKLARETGSLFHDEHKAQLERIADALDTPKQLVVGDGLLACPFCGSSDVGIEEESGGTGLPHVLCLNCLATGPKDEEWKDEAIARWNTRLAVGDEPLALDGMPAVHPYAIVRYKRAGDAWKVTSIEQTEIDPEADIRAIGFATVAGRQSPSRPAASRPCGRPSTIARGER